MNQLQNLLHENDQRHGMASHCNANKTWKKWKEDDAGTKHRFHMLRQSDVTAKYFKL